MVSEYQIKGVMIIKRYKRKHVAGLPCDKIVTFLKQLQTLLLIFLLQQERSFEKLP